MRKMRHSKFRNTGILFELLTRQITADIIAGKEAPFYMFVKVKRYKIMGMVKLIFSQVTGLILNGFPVSID